MKQENAKHNSRENKLVYSILQKVLTFSNTSILLCGDWNVVLDRYMDTYNIIHYRNPYSRKKIDEIIEAFELLDPWRTRYPDERKYTWRQSSPIKQSRLDYFLVSEDLYSLMKYTKIIPEYKTDHSAIIFTFATSLAKRGKGYWKFNSQLLRDTDYIKRVKTCITETISEYYLSGHLNVMTKFFFEILKMKIRSISITYSIKKNLEKKRVYIVHLKMIYKI